MTGPSPDLDALRDVLYRLEAGEAALVEIDLDEFHPWDGEDQDGFALDMLAVLALVDEQRKENERLREALRFYADPETYATRQGLLMSHPVTYSNIDGDDGHRARAALAGSPADTKEQP